MHLVKKERKRKKGGTKTTHPRQLDATKRALEALSLREQNLHYREIAERVGYNSPEAAQMAVSNILKRTVFESVDEYREIIRGRLEKQANNLLPFTQPQKISGRNSISIDAVREYRMLQAELAKLHGCYVEVVVNTGDHIGVQNVQNNVVMKLDLTKLNEKELEQYAGLLARLTPAESVPANGAAAAAGTPPGGNGAAH